MFKIATVIGTRPQIIKSSILSNKIKSMTNVEHIIIDTGQHYDHDLSEIFYKQMNLDLPKYNLNVGSGTHTYQVSEMMKRIEKIFQIEKPDLIIVYGDTNSTLSAAIVGKQNNIKIMHIEAGLRSFDKEMPEEINRILTDHVSSYLIVPTKNAKLNLLNEGFPRKNIKNYGDVLLDASIIYSKKIDHTKFLYSFDLERKKYAIITIHRVENHTISRITKIFEQLEHISKHLKLLISLHPGTLKFVKKNKLKILENKKFCIVRPLSYLDMLASIKNSKIVITDSGGVQRESYFHCVPSIIIRSQNEWTEIIDEKASMICQPDELLNAFKFMSNKKVKRKDRLFGAGNAAKKICNFIESIV